MPSPALHGPRNANHREIDFQMSFEFPEAPKVVRSSVNAQKALVDNFDHICALMEP